MASDTSGANGEHAIEVTSDGFLNPSLSPDDGHPFVRGPQYADGACSLCRFVRSRHGSRGGNGPRLYAVEWTHGDGMDQHDNYASLTPDEAAVVSSLLVELEAVNPTVYEPTPTTLEEIVAEIREDLDD